MRFVILSGVVGFILLLACLALLEVGRRIGRQRLAADPAGETAGFAAVETAVFGLLGLLLAFTFSGALTRFDERRQLIVEEANAISAAYLRLDLLPEAARAPLREKMRAYLDARLEVSRLPRRMAGGQEFMAAEPVKKAAALSVDIWQVVIAANQVRRSESVEQVLLPSLNAVNAVARARNSAGQRHAPEIVYAMLLGLSLASSLLAGYAMAASKTRSWVHMLGFATALAATVFVICDIEFPRQGLIRVDMVDQVLANALAGLR